MGTQNVLYKVCKVVISFKGNEVSSILGQQIYFPFKVKGSFILLSRGYTTMGTQKQLFKVPKLVITFKGNEIASVDRDAQKPIPI